MKLIKNIAFRTQAVLAVALLLQTAMTRADDRAGRNDNNETSDANAAFSVTVGAGHAAGNIMARAKNGESVELAGAGVMDAGAETASLSGTYLIRDSEGKPIASGAWHSTQFLSWEPTLACTGGFTGFVSGTAMFKVQLAGVGEARLTVTCAGCETPMGIDKITLHIKQGSNFKESVNNEGPGGGLFNDGLYMNLFFRL